MEEQGGGGGAQRSNGWDGSGEGRSNGGGRERSNGWDGSSEGRSNGGGRERSNGWDAASEGRSNGGWPLGLQPMNARISTASSHFIISTPSLTSSSSSDFDSESTGSFFPEKSTTLGSLIGIQSSSEIALARIHLIEEEKMTRKSTSGNSRNRMWCPLLGCGGGLQEDSLEESPSLAHLLDKERRETLSQRQTPSNSVDEHNQEEDSEEEEIHTDQIVSDRNTLCNNTCIIPSGPSGPSLKHLLQQPSPIYPSAEWNVCGDMSQHYHFREDTSHGRSHTFWPGFCGRLSTSLAN